MHKTTRAIMAIVAISVGLSYLAQRPTAAYPKYKKKENLTSCTYCHVKPSGGQPINYRGDFYKAHDLSFAGFDDAAAAKAAGVAVAPDAEEKPASLTAPAATAPATPVATPVPTPAPMKSATPAAKSPSAAAEAKATSAKTAYTAKPTDAKLKATYVSALTSLSHTYLSEKRYADCQTVAKKALVLDPKNTAAKADVAAATAGMKKK